jgi:hypothetical protein
LTKYRRAANVSAGEKTAAIPDGPVSAGFWRVRVFFRIFLQQKD